MAATVVMLGSSISFPKPNRNVHKTFENKQAKAYQQSSSSWSVVQHKHKNCFQVMCREDSRCRSGISSDDVFFLEFWTFHELRIIFCILSKDLFFIKLSLLTYSNLSLQLKRNLKTVSLLTYRYDGQLAEMTRF